MVCVDALACSAAAALFSAVGFVATLDAWGTAYSRRFRRLLWLVPVFLVSAWLESAFGPGATRPGSEGSVPLAALYRHLGTDVLGWSVLSCVFLWLRRFMPGKLELPPAGEALTGTLQANIENFKDTELVRATEGFLASVDSANRASIAATYAPAFLCVRVADEGGFAHLTREEMLAFLNRPGGHSTSAEASVPTRQTAIHHAEVVGDIGLVLLTRVKNLGSGWEPMFYSFIWEKQDGDWQLLREFVHQRSIPRWR